MPERIYAGYESDGTAWWHERMLLTTEYIRADVAAAQLAERDARVAELEAAQRANSEIVGLIAQWAFTDGSHHRQWLLDQILRAAAGNNYETVVSRLYEWDEGVPP